MTSARLETIMRGQTAVARKAYDAIPEGQEFTLLQVSRALVESGTRADLNVI